MDPERGSSQFTVEGLSENGFSAGPPSFGGVGGVDGIDGADGVDGVGGFDSRGIRPRGGRDSVDLRDGLIGGRYTSLASSVSASEFGPCSGEVEEERNDKGNDFPLWGHKDEARFVLGAGSGPAAVDTDGEGGPAKSDECLYGLGYEPRESELGRMWGFLFFRGNGGGLEDARAVKESKKSASSWVSPMTSSRLVGAERTGEGGGDRESRYLAQRTSSRRTGLKGDGGCPKCPKASKNFLRVVGPRSQGTAAFVGSVRGWAIGFHGRRF